MNILFEFDEFEFVPIENRIETNQMEIIPLNVNGMRVCVRVCV